VEYGEKMAKFNKPCFLLQKVYSDDLSDEPVVYRMEDIDGDWEMGRRGFLAISAVGIGLLSGCNKHVSWNRREAIRKEIEAATPVTIGKCDDGINAHGKRIFRVCFSPRGNFLASNSNDNRVKFWEIPSCKLIRVFENASSSLFSPDGRFIATLDSNWNSDIKLWETTSGKLLQTFKGNPHHIKNIAFSPDGKLLAAGDDDRKVKLWEIPSGKLLHTLNTGKYITDKVSFSPNGKYLASALSVSDKFLKIWEIPSGKSLLFFRAHKRGSSNTICIDIAFSPDGKLLASGADDKKVKLWEIPSGKLLHTLNGHENYVDKVAFSPDGKFLASCSHDTKLWEVSSGKLKATLTERTGVVNISFSPDGKILASACRGNVSLWQIPSGKLLRLLKCMEWTVRSIAFSPDGKFLATAGESKSIKIFEMPSGKFLTCLFDPGAMDRGKKAMQYTYTNEYGHAITYALPCGSPIPPGAICTCNCVPGTYSPPAPSGGYGGGRICTCVPVCTCVPIK
jgi:WD40 repeat protein